MSKLRRRPGRARARPRPVAHGATCGRCGRLFRPLGLTPVFGAGIVGALGGAAVQGLASHYLGAPPLSGMVPAGYRILRHVQALAHLCIGCALALYQPAPLPIEPELAARGATFLRGGLKS